MTSRVTVTSQTPPLRKYGIIEEVTTIKQGIKT